MTTCRFLPASRTKNSPVLKDVRCLILESEDDQSVYSGQTAGGTFASGSIVVIVVGQNEDVCENVGHSTSKPFGNCLIGDSVLGG